MITNDLLSTMKINGGTSVKQFKLVIITLYIILLWV